MANDDQAYLRHPSNEDTESLQWECGALRDCIEYETSTSERSLRVQDIGDKKGSLLRHCINRQKAIHGCNGVVKVVKTNFS